MDRRVAVLAGGCFWCLEAVFLELKGVLSVESGYCGGTLPDPSYEEVCGGRTGHAEAVRVEFDAQRIGYRDLLDVFFGIHDPTTPDRQGNDVGSQYRSAIFFVDEVQRREAQEAIERLERECVFDARIVTQVVPLGRWYPAEPYHQRYFERNPNQGYCSAVVSPKVAKFRKRFAHLRT
ncbi:MAG: peptide-methionine (S)-S-oxide reductase [Lautropia sp.]|nr:MAG: peptide-methionine (S)-S-oxide reductase [Pseudomonadota bacterium]MBC6959469.1 peptide-methionine (S)-S-oxide reductase [Lautropia sp.]MCL4703046.1 peptide-methionine (S)-S-oxide reductase MsrA [Burkholderiaceae bacterium]MDL1908516.1 peptide-methionine (S)-S-oxide reductase MsrA [Betaproteobacteria bacterium PRO1]RIK89318.1 MAG: peptide-methionine (S)-S-oxide reductase [Burkholderiales bacterium]